MNPTCISMRYRSTQIPRYLFSMNQSLWITWETIFFILYWIKICNQSCLTNKKTHGKRWLHKIVSKAIVWCSVNGKIINFLDQKIPIIENSISIHQQLQRFNRRLYNSRVDKKISRRSKEKNNAHHLIHIQCELSFKGLTVRPYSKTYSLQPTIWYSL